MPLLGFQTVRPGTLLSKAEPIIHAKMVHTLKFGFKTTKNVDQWYTVCPESTRVGWKSLSTATKQGDELLQSATLLLYNFCRIARRK